MRGRLKVGIVVAGMLFFLALMVRLTVADAQAMTAGFAAPGTVTVQATPTVDPAITAKTAQEQLTKLQRDNDRSFQAWFWSSGAAVLSTLAVALAGFFGFLRYLRDQRSEREKQREDRQTERERRDEEQQRWLKDQEAEREKRAEERFQAAVEGLGDEKEGARVGAAILLRTFLQPGHEQFYVQTFDLAVANLRLRHFEPGIPEPLTSLSQALVIAFKESFPLARKKLKQPPRFLDASRIQLDNAHLSEADLRHIWLPEASLRNAALRKADLSEAATTPAAIRAVFAGRTKGSST